MILHTAQEAEPELPRKNVSTHQLLVLGAEFTHKIDFLDEVRSGTIYVPESSIMHLTVPS